MNKYLKFEYWNTCDLGNIYYQGGQHFWFYLDADILEPFHEETEDGPCEHCQKKWSAKTGY